MTSLLSLPEEILLKILSYLKEADVLRLLLVCKSLNNFISNSNTALENVQIKIQDSSADSFNILMRKYSNIRFSLYNKERITRNVAMVQRLGEQLRVLHIDTCQNFKRSYIPEMMSNCKFLKELTINFTDMEMDEIYGQLPTTKIKKLTVFGKLNSLGILKHCKVRKLFVQFNNLVDQNQVRRRFNHLQKFFNCQPNLEVFELRHCQHNLKAGMLPGNLKELTFNNFQPLVNYDFAKIVEAQNLKRLKTEIQVDPKFLNQLSELKSLTHLDLHLGRGGVTVFANLNVMQHVTNLTINNYLAEQEFLMGKFPNLKYLKFINWSDAKFLDFLFGSLRLIFGQIPLFIRYPIMRRMPTVLKGINCEEFELFILECCEYKKDIRDREIITESRFRMKEIALKMDLFVNNFKVKLKLILKKSKNLSLNRRNPSNLPEFNFQILSKIFSFLDYKENLNLRLVCKRFNAVIKESPEFTSKTFFEVNRENYQYQNVRKFSNIVISDFGTHPDFDWCFQLFKNIGVRLMKLILYLNAKVPSMIVRNLMNLSPNVKEIEIFENDEESQTLGGAIDVSKHPNLKLDSLKIRGNLRVLNVFQKSEIKNLILRSPTNSYKLFDFLSCEDLKVETLEISNQNLNENFAILRTLDAHFNLNLSSINPSLEVEKFPLIESIIIDFTTPGCFKRVRFRNLHDLTPLNSFNFIETLHLTDSTIDVSQTLPCVKNLILRSCKIVTSPSDKSREGQFVKLSKSEIKSLAKRLLGINEKLEEVDAENISMFKSKA